MVERHVADALHPDRSGARRSNGRRAGVAGDPAPAAVGGHVDLDHVPLPVLILSGSGAVRGVNTAWSRLFRGIPDLDRPGAPRAEPAVVDRCSVHSWLRSALESGRAGSGEVRITTGGAQRWTRWWWHPSDDGEGLVVCVVDIDADKQREISLLQRASRDPLTGLLNRDHFLDLVERALRRLPEAETPPVVVFVDLDDFKAVNDEFGHDAGDEVLQAVAARLTAAVRPADVVARMGGVEFAVLCEDLREVDDLDVVTGRLREAVEAPLFVAGQLRRLTATCGAAPGVAADTATGLVRRADQGMYGRRRAARGRTARTRAGDVAVATQPEDRAAATAPLDLVGRSVQLLSEASELLAQAWHSAMGDHGRSQQPDRLVRAVRLTRAAVDALDERTLF
jgi:diguanylate cyclase (GGDEF)-like protein